MRYVCVTSLVSLCLCGSALFGSDEVSGSIKNGAFFAIGGSYTPQIPYNVLSLVDSQTQITRTALYGGGIKYGAKHYFGNALGLRLYVPLQAGYSRFDAGYSSKNATFAALGMGGDILFDIGSSRKSIGIFAGGEVSYAYYWLGGSNAKGLQTEVHTGVSLNFNPHFTLQMGIKHYIDRPSQARLALGSSWRDYGAFVDFVFSLDNSDISRSYALREEARQKAKEQQAKEEAARIAAHNRNIYANGGVVYGSSNPGGGMSAFFGALLGGLLGSSTNADNRGGSYYSPRQSPPPQLKMR